MTQTEASSTEAIERRTGMPFTQWRSRLDEAGAADMPHGEVARLVHPWLTELGVTNAGWWAQTVTVAYEQHIGRRVPGQSCAGDFQAGVSRTIPADLDEAQSRVVALLGDRSDMDGVAVEGEPRLSETPKWRYWRASLENGSRVEVTTGVAPANASGAARSRVTVGHSALGSAEDVQRWRGFWKRVLADL